MTHDLYKDPSAIIIVAIKFAQTHYYCIHFLKVIKLRYSQFLKEKAEPEYK